MLEGKLTDPVKKLQISNYILYTLVIAMFFISLCCFFLPDVTINWSRKEKKNQQGSRNSQQQHHIYFQELTLWHLDLDLLSFELFEGILCVKVSPSDWKLPLISTLVLSFEYIFVTPYYSHLQRSTVKMNNYKTIPCIKVLKKKNGLRICNFCSEMV